MRFALVQLLSLFLCLPLCLYAQESNGDQGGELVQELVQSFKIELLPNTKDIPLQFSHDQQKIQSKNIKLATEEEGKVLVISFDELQVQRAWQKLTHPLINRALLYPSKKTSRRSYLKIRFQQALTKQAMSLIKISENQDKIDLLIPQTAFIIASPKSNTDLPLMVASDQKSTEAIPVVELSNTPELSLSNENDQDNQENTQSVKELQKPITAPEANDFLPDARNVIAMHENLADEIHETLQQISQNTAVLVLPTSNEDELKVSKSQALLSQNLMQALMSKESHVLWLDEKRLTHYAHSLHRDQEEDYRYEDMKKLGKIAGADLAFHAKLFLKTPTQLILESKLYSLKDGSLVLHEKHPLAVKEMQALEADMIISPSKGGAFWRSLILPGWGQIYGNQKAKGWAFLGAGLGLLAGAGSATTYGFMAEQDYNTFEAQYAHRRADANMHYDRANLLLLGYGALWLSSLLDAYFSTSEETVVDHQRLHDEVQKAGK
jgi:hypothetical protein